MQMMMVEVIQGSQLAIAKMEEHSFLAESSTIYTLLGRSGFDFQLY